MKKIVALFMVFAFFGCALFSGLDPTTLKSSHARARFVNVTYTAAWDDYQRLARLPNLTPDAKELLNAKRAILADLNFPISVFNGYAETNSITDAMYDELLKKLLELETGWYTGSQAVEDVRGAIAESGIISDTSAQVDPIFMGVLIELLRTGLHAWRAILSQKNLDEEQMRIAWQESYDRFKSLNVNDLVVIN